MTAGHNFNWFKDLWHDVLLTWFSMLLSTNKHINALFLNHLTMVLQVKKITSLSLSMVGFQLNCFCLKALQFDLNTKWDYSQICFYYIFAENSSQTKFTNRAKFTNENSEYDLYICDYRLNHISSTHHHMSFLCNFTTKNM